MQINYGKRERASSIMIAFDRKDSGALHQLASLEDDLIRHIAARNQDVSALFNQTFDE
jgi:hypothetical protein